MPRYIVVGRSRDCDVVLAEASVSGRHTRFAWEGQRIRVEDLGSANGTWVDGARVLTALIRPGDDVRLGEASLPWSDRRLLPFLRRGALGDTLKPGRLTARRFACGACGFEGVLPVDPRREVRCRGCGARLVVGTPPPRRAWVGVLLGSLVLAIGALTVAIVHGGSTALARAAERFGLGPADDVRARSAEEEAIRATSMPRVVAAIDAADATTRNTAVRIAAADGGPYHVEQIARVWSYVRGHWRYVNDPRGVEYIATASETIANDYAGDCDDFAIVMAAMVTAIGGDARVVMMDGPGGGHAYAEACIHDQPGPVAQRLSEHYRATSDPNLGPQHVDEVHFRASTDCPMWVNLDWSAGVPGGPYQSESWAVAIRTDGRTETLAPARP
jgi:hypothetical protein